MSHIYSLTHVAGTFIRYYYGARNAFIIVCVNVCVCVCVCRQSWTTWVRCGSPLRCLWIPSAVETTSESWRFDHKHHTDSCMSCPRPNPDPAWPLHKLTLTCHLPSFDSTRCLSCSVCVLSSSFQGSWVPIACCLYDVNVRFVYVWVWGCVCALQGKLGDLTVVPNRYSHHE